MSSKGQQQADKSGVVSGIDWDSLRDIRLHVRAIMDPQAQRNDPVSTRVRGPDFGSSRWSDYCMMVVLSAYSCTVQLFVSVKRDPFPTPERGEGPARAHAVTHMHNHMRISVDCTLVCVRVRSTVSAGRGNMTVSTCATLQ